MRNKEAIELVKKEYIDNYNPNTVHIEQVSETTLINLLSVCDSTKHMEERIDWYDDEEYPDRNNWVDVEGEGYGWLWVKEENDETKWHGLLRELLLEFIKTKEPTIGDTDDYAVIVNTDQKTIYHFVYRESSMYDRIYTFSDEEFDF